MLRLLELDIFTQIDKSDRQRVIECIFLDVEFFEDLSEPLRTLQRLLHLGHLIAHHVYLFDEDLVLAAKQFFKIIRDSLDEFSSFRGRQHLQIIDLHIKC